MRHKEVKCSKIGVAVKAFLCCTLTTEQYHLFCVCSLCWVPEAMFRSGVSGCRLPWKHLQKVTVQVKWLRGFPSWIVNLKTNKKTSKQKNKPQPTSTPNRNDRQVLTRNLKIIIMHFYTAPHFSKMPESPVKPWGSTTNRMKEKSTDVTFFRAGSICTGALGRISVYKVVISETWTCPATRD